MSSGAAIAASCESLSALKFDKTTIDAAKSHAGGDYAPASGAQSPTFRLSAGSMARSRQSKARMSGSRFGCPGPTGTVRSMLGNGGYSSAMAFPAMAEQLKHGYAVAATDTGHKGDDPDFAAGHPEAIVDWASRAVHVSIDAAKAVASDFYGQSARHAYFWGCSTGGQQALIEASATRKTSTASSPATPATIGRTSTPASSGSSSRTTAAPTSASSCRRRSSR